MSETRHIWLVDRQPAQASDTGLNNVTSSIEVSMELKSTSAAPERRTVPVTLVGVPTHRTLLRSVPGINQKNLLHKSLGFIPEEVLEFGEHPVVQLPPERRVAPFLDSKLSQVFESEDRGIGVYNLFRYTMVGIGHKPSFPPRHLAEFPRCRAGSFGLQLLEEIRILRSRILHPTGVEKRVIGTDGDVHNSPVNTEDLDLLYRHHIGTLDRDMPGKDPRFPVVREGRGGNGPREVLAVILRNRERRFDPSSHRGKGDDAMHQVHCDDPLVVPHGGERLPLRQRLAFDGFQRFTRTIACALHQRGRKIRNGLTNSLVGRLVVLHFVPRAILESPVCGQRERRGIGSCQWRDKSAQ